MGTLAGFVGFGSIVNRPSRRCSKVVCMGDRPGIRKVDPRGFTVPDVGEVVIVPGRWPGQETVAVVDNVQVKDDRTSCVVDVVELKSVGVNLYAKPRTLSKQNRRYYDVGDVRVAQSEFVTAQDAFKVNDVKDGYPEISEFDTDKQKQYMQDYREMKAKLLREAAVTGAVGSIVFAVLSTPFLGLTFGVSSLCGLSYMALLQKSIDRIESGSMIYLTRFLLPVAPFGFLIASHDGGALDIQSWLWSLPREEVLTVAMGFLSFRLPIFRQSAVELINDLKGTKVKPRGTLSSVIAAAQSMRSNQEKGRGETAAIETGKLIVISGCSGVGKSTIISKLLADYGNRLSFSVSYTTRPRREGEVDGVSYHFVDKEEFERKIEAEELVEWAKVYGNYYGTSIEAVKKVIREKKTCLLDVDIQGVALVYKQQMADGIYIWIAPPSMEALESRLRSRGTEDEGLIRQRLSEATDEMSFAATSNIFDLTIVNDDLDTAYAKLCSAVGPFLDPSPA